MIQTKSIRLLADFMARDDLPVEITDYLEQLDNAVYSLPDSGGIQDSIEVLLIETIKATKAKGDPPELAFSMCASCIAGATTVIQCAENS